MSETIDLTRDHNSDDAGRKSDQANHQEGQRKRHKSSSRPKSVYVVIHDKEPPSSARRAYGRRSSFLPSRQDTEIITIHYDYSAAVSAAVEYVMEEFEVYEDEGDEGNPLSHVDWRGKGWFREEEYDVNVCNDRVRIEKHDVK